MNRPGYPDYKVNHSKCCEWNKKLNRILSNIITYSNDTRSMALTK